MTGSAVHLAFPDNNGSGGIRRGDPCPYQEDGTSLTELPEDFFSTAVYSDKLAELVEDWERFADETGIVY